MIKNIHQLRVTMEQMERLFQALDDMRENVLPRDPRLFALMAEAPLDDLNRMRAEISEYAQELNANA